MEDCRCSLVWAFLLSTPSGHLVGMKKYDDVVVGSGISGLTMTLFLAMNGRKVLLLEKSPRIGGSLTVFSRDGVPFDTGFHFTGGLQKGGLLHDMLSALGIYDSIQPVFLPEDNANSFFLESENRLYEIPYGFRKMRERFKGYFPSEAAAIDKYFDKVLQVCAETPSMDLRESLAEPDPSGRRFHDTGRSIKRSDRQRCIEGPVVRSLLCATESNPGRSSFANHSRICLGLYESVARIQGGGNALIEAFQKEISGL